MAAVAQINTTPNLGLEINKANDPVVHEEDFDLKRRIMEVANRAARPPWARLTPAHAGLLQDSLRMVGVTSVDGKSADVANACVSAALRTASGMQHRLAGRAGAT